MGSRAVRQAKNDTGWTCVAYLARNRFKSPYALLYSRRGVTLVSSMLLYLQHCSFQTHICKTPFPTLLRRVTPRQTHRHELQGIDSEQTNFSDIHPSRGWGFSLQYKAGDDPRPAYPHKYIQAGSAADAHSGDIPPSPLSNPLSSPSESLL